MIEHPSCPLCQASNLRAIGSRRYVAPPADRASASYVNRRLAVLFDLWCPGRSELEVTSLLCDGCGLIIYGPRPSQAELDAKYNVLHGRSAGESPAAAPVAVREATHGARAQEIYRTVASLSGRQPVGLRVLDYGGGSGRLMAPFLQSGCPCDLVDLSNDQIAGVRKVGSTLDDLPAASTYDLIIASHVMEHVADPLAIVRALAAHLQPDGQMFVEVPMEVWGRPPLHPEPVTHVNFFTRTSLRYMLEAAGLRVVRCRYISSVHPLKHGSRFAAIKALAVRAPGAGRPPLPGPGDAEELLSPLPLQRLRSALRYPRAVASSIGYRIRSGLGRR